MGATGAECASVALVFDFDDKGKRHVKSLKIRKTLLLPFSLLLLAFAANAAGLPTGYTELESISSTGTQYIDTGYTHKANTKIVCEVSVASEQPGTWAGVFGARKNSFQSNAFCFFAKCDNDANKACYNRSGDEMRSESAFPKGVKTTLTCEGANATWTTVDGTSGSIVTTGTCDDGANTMFVFNLNTADADGKRADTSPCAMTLYSFRIYEDESLVREFVPCLNDAFEAGLCETLTGEFHANAGEGELDCSPDSRVAVRIPAHTTGVWTSGAGKKTNDVVQGQFRVLPGTENVTVILTAIRPYCFTDKSETKTVVLGRVSAAVASDDARYADCGTVVDIVEYIDANGDEKVCLDYEFVTNETSVLSDGWYVVAGTVERGGIDVAAGCTAHLILADGASLTVQGADRGAGIDVSSGETLNIYAQRCGTGRLSATGGDGAAGIGGGYKVGGGEVIINGGTVTATGGGGGAGIGGGNDGVGCTVMINGGTVMATGGDGAAGIGGGYDSVGRTVTINGGTVTATGGDWGGAGIGGGIYRAGGTVTINGGTVTATGNWSGAGIGGGYHGEGGAVTINGGTVTAMSDIEGAGIGGGYKGDGGEVTINGGTVTAKGGVRSVGIGGGLHSGDQGTVTFGPAWTVGVFAGESETNRVYVSRTAYASDHSAAYVWACKNVLSILSEAFCVGDAAAVVVPVHEGDSVVGHRVTLGTNHTHGVTLPTDVGVVTIDLNGWTIRGPEGVAGTAASPGGKGGAAITVAGTSGVNAGETTIVVNPALPSDATGAPIGAASAVGDVMVVDLERNVEGRFPVHVYRGVDMGVFNCDAYKTSKIVLRRIPKGVAYPVEARATNYPITKTLVPQRDFYVGLFEITGAQYDRVMGAESPSASMTPKRYASYPDFRSPTGSTQLDPPSADKFIGILLADAVDASGNPVGGFDLPTANQWEIAARAGATGEFGAYLDENGLLVEGTSENVAAFAQTGSGHVVGSLRPNAWGIYDMCGGVGEWCRTSGNDVETVVKDSYWPLRGNGVISWEIGYILSGYNSWTGYSGVNCGARLSCALDVSELMWNDVGGVCGGKGGDGNPPGRGGFAVADVDGNEVAVDDLLGLCASGTYGNPLVLIPNHVDRTYVVSNLTARVEMEDVGGDGDSGGAVYALPLGARVGIYTVAKRGYEVVRSEPYVIETVTPELVIDAVELEQTAEIVPIIYTVTCKLPDDIAESVSVDVAVDGVPVAKRGEGWPVAHGRTATVTFTSTTGLVFAKYPASETYSVEVEISGQNPDAVTCPRLLPVGYTPLQSISSTGAQYIDTGYTHKANTKIVCEVSVASEQPSSWAGIFGARKNSYQSNAFCFFAKCDKDANKACYNRSGNEMRSEVAFPKGVKTTLTCEGANATWTTVDGTSGSIVTTGTCDDGANTMFVFNLNTAGAGDKKADASPCVMTLYSFRIYEGESLVREFVPCLNAAFKAGLCETLTGEFHANAGEGEFACSPDLWAVVRVPSHVEGVWSSGDGTVTNEIEGGFFRVLKGTENVKVIMAPDPAYVFATGVLTSMVELDAVNEDIDLRNCFELVHREVEYIDENGELRTNDTFSVVTAATSQLTDGWYLVEGTVERGGIDVAADCTAHLILADGASLTVQGSYGEAGVDVRRGETLNIYAQRCGTGRLTASGGDHGAGIGGGEYGDGGTITIRGGTVTATGSYCGAGIGGGLRGAGGTVTINGGAVDAVAGERAARIGPGSDGNVGDVKLSGGVFAHELEDGWCSDGFVVGNNLDPLTCADYPYTVLPGVMVTVGGLEQMTAVWTSGDGSKTNVVKNSHFAVLKGAENVKVIFSPKDPAHVFASGASTSVVELDVVNEDIDIRESFEIVHRQAEYVNEDGELRTNDTFSVVTAATAQLTDGWYLVEGTVKRGAIDVAAGCTANLILADGASLTVQGAWLGAGIDVCQVETLVIYGQREGTGRLSASGGAYGAGIGGGARGVGGTITINGGTVTATGGPRGAGIGGGDDGAGGTVTINGGAVNAVAGERAARIGPGYGGKVGDVAISGGVFAHELEDGWLAEGCGVLNNSDPKTHADYPYVVLPVATVTVGELNHMTAAWTSGDGTETNAIDDVVFRVPKGTENVKVIFTAQAPFCFADGAIVVEVAVGTIENDRSVAVPVVRQPTIETFGEGCYLESSGGAWIDTEYVHTSTTRVEGVMSVAEDQPSSWAAIFGARKNSYQSNAFCFFAKCDNDANKACYNRSGNEMRSTAAFPKGVKTTLTCEGAKATWTNEYGTDGIVTTGTCDGGVNTLFVFNLNTADAAGKRADTSPCAMKLYAFRICEGETLVRDFVPARTKDERKILGLYDRITGEFFVNCGDGDFSLGYDGPTCEGGEIEWSETANAWVVTPDEGVTAVTIAGLPTGATLAVPPTVAQVGGVADEQIMVRSDGYDITGAFTVSGGGIALNPNGVVTIGGETIPVKPTIGELGCFDGEPFAVGENGASITIRTIPGLFYGFRKGSSLPDGEFAVLVWAKAERTNLSFTDKSQPEQAAFYDIKVRACVEEPIPSDGSVEVKSENDPEILTIVGLNVDAANGRVILKVGAEKTANVDSVVAGLFNITVKKGAEVTVRVEHAESPNGPWTELSDVVRTVTVDHARADIEVELDGNLPSQGFFRAKIEE